jgi:hypothetical protein
MLKISTKGSKNRRLLILEGKLVAPWANELRAVCNEPSHHPDERPLVIDVRGVTDISADGEQVLLCLMGQGAKFRGTGVFMKQVLKELARRVHRNDHTEKSKTGSL